MEVTQAVDQGTNLFSLFTIMGFSLFIGYAIGMAIKKIMFFGIFVIGVFFLGVTLLAYNGFLSVQWESLQGGYDTIASGLAATGNAYLGWLVAQLPIASSGTIGLLMGFKRH